MIRSVFIFIIEFVKLCWYTSPFVMMDFDEAEEKSRVD